jgi:hypothetical protein
VQPQFGNFVCALEKLICAESCVMHNYNNFHAQKKSVVVPKKKENSAQDSKPRNQKKKNVARNDFWRLIPNKWPSRQNMKECVFWLNGLFLGSDDRDSLKEDMKTYLLMDQN